MRKQKKRPYCIKIDGQCANCSLVSYGRDCHNVPVPGSFINKAKYEEKKKIDNMKNNT